MTKSFAVSKISKSQSGFTMLETVMALALLWTVLYSSTWVYSSSSRFTHQDRRRWHAAELGSMVMEELSFSYSTSQLLTPGQTVRYYDNNYQTTSQSNAIYTVTYVVTENTPIFGISNIALDVSWQEAGITKRVHYETLR